MAAISPGGGAEDRLSALQIAQREPASSAQW